MVTIEKIKNEIIYKLKNEYYQAYNKEYEDLKKVFVEESTMDFGFNITFLTGILIYFILYFNFIYLF